MFLLCQLSGDFFKKKSWISIEFCQNFLWIYWNDHMVFIFQFVNMVYHIDWFAYMLNNPCIWGINLTWSWYMIFLMSFQILFPRILLWIFAYVHQWYQRRQWHPTPVLLPGKIPWTEEPGRLQSMGSLRVRHDWATSLSLFTFMHWRRKWQPTPVFLPGKFQGRGSLVGCHLWGHTESDTTEVT